MSEYRQSLAFADKQAYLRYACLSHPHLGTIHFSSLFLFSNVRLLVRTVFHQFDQSACSQSFRTQANKLFRIIKGRNASRCLDFDVLPTWVFISFTSANVAPSVENPVDVLMYSAPAFVTISHILIFSSSVSRQFSMITSRSGHCTFRGFGGSHPRFPRTFRLLSAQY